MNKKFTIAGILILVGGMFSHPEACMITPISIIGQVIPLDPAVLSHISTLLGGLILAFSKGLMEKKDVSTNDIQASGESYPGDGDSIEKSPE